jgi:hypothetical protein
MFDVRLLDGVDSFPERVFWIAVVLSGFTCGSVIVSGAIKEWINSPTGNAEHKMRHIHYHPNRNRDPPPRLTLPYLKIRFKFYKNKSAYPLEQPLGPEIRTNMVYKKLLKCCLLFPALMFACVSASVYIPFQPYRFRPFLCQR